MILDTTVCTRTSDAVLREVAGEHLLVPIRQGRLVDAESLYILDDVGASVWRLLEAPRTLHALAERVRAEYEVPAGADVAGDIRAFVSDLVDQGLVRAGESA